MTFFVIASGVVCLVPSWLLFRWLRIARRWGRPMRWCEVYAGVWTVYTIARVAGSLVWGFSMAWSVIAAPLLLIGVAVLVREHFRHPEFMAHLRESPIRTRSHAATILARAEEDGSDDCGS